MERDQKVAVTILISFGLLRCVQLVVACTMQRRSLRRTKHICAAWRLNCPASLQRTRH
jgi:hypothetical protein